MTSRNVLYGANTSSQSVAVNGVISFGSPVRRYGNRINMSGGNVVVNGNGYFDVIANVSFTGAAGTTTISLYKDGVVIPGTESSLTTEANTKYTVTVPALVKNRCGEGIITAVVSGLAATVTSASVKVIAV